MPEIAIWIFIKKAWSVVAGNKYLAIGLAIIVALGAGYFFFKHDVATQVKQQVTQHDNVASAVAQQTQQKADAKSAVIDKTYDAKALVKQKEYAVVRQTTTEPEFKKTADDRLDPLLLDTINQLAGLHAPQHQDAVPDSVD